ncbi:MAG: helix-turn-helix domain-containing protein [Aestuariivita sp.]|nr:helix-turn-helix domain-containing protein [Aestuariivita sp.]MCY4345544.1 helix-turn-helix domain-containing protein [Aestuariivita sp.]
MIDDGLTGSRIREHRRRAGMNQSELAQMVGISAPYLSLIEHNRRRIGGKCLNAIARALAVDVAALAEGAKASVTVSLLEAAANARHFEAEIDSMTEFVGRFPGWAQILATSRRRLLELEQMVEIFSDRIRHDPQLGSALHEVLSVVTSIRSTSAILVQQSDLDPVWVSRFHRNLNEDSLRLAASAKSLVDYLEQSQADRESLTLPVDEMENFLTSRQYHFSELEQESCTEQDVIDGYGEWKSETARKLVKGYLEQYRADARVIPLAAMLEALQHFGLDPAALSERFAVSMQVMFRRLVAMPETALGTSIGLLVCDASGSILSYKPVEGFAVSRYGSSCPIWPIYAAFSRPHQPLKRVVRQMGSRAECFTCYAVAYSHVPLNYSADPVYRSSMLIVPHEFLSNDKAMEVGTTCLVCPLTDCKARR